jgi:hypothetical protein
VYEAKIWRTIIATTAAGKLFLRFNGFILKNKTYKSTRHAKVDGVAEMTEIFRTRSTGNAIVARKKVLPLIERRHKCNAEQ